MTILNIKKDSSSIALFSSILLLCGGNFAFAAKASLGPVYAAGLVYKKHIKDSAESVDQKKGPVIFLKQMRSLVLAEQSVDVRIPSQNEIYADLDALEPGISKTLNEKFPDGFPKMLDYEAEIGVHFTRDVSWDELSGSALKNAVSFFSANDVSMRSVQILGEKQDNKSDFWSLAKSFKRFMPVSQPKVVSQLSLDQWPVLYVRSWVNGESRQNDTTADIAYTPRKIFQNFDMKFPGKKIPAGAALLTGTPAGTAFKVSKIKKFFANFLFLSRFSMLKIAAKSAADDPNFLKAGDEVIVEVQGVGQNRIRVVE